MQMWSTGPWTCGRGCSLGPRISQPICCWCSWNWGMQCFLEDSTSVVALTWVFFCELPATTTVIGLPGKLFWESPTALKLFLHKGSHIQLDSANLNLVILEFMLFQTQNHFPWICPSVIYYWLFWNSHFLHCFPFPVIARLNCALNCVESNWMQKDCIDWGSYTAPI